MSDKKREIIFELRKIISKNGCVVRESHEIKSNQIVTLPKNSIVAINNPPKIKVDNFKHRIEIIQPIKGWIFEDDLLDLDTVEYLKYGIEYEKYLNNLIKARGEDYFMKQIDFNIKKKGNNKVGELKIVYIPESSNENSIDLNEIKAYRNFDNLKDKMSLKILELDEDIYYNQLKNSKLPCLLYFGASWCRPCHNIRPLLEEIINNLEGINLYLCDVDINPSLIEKLKVNKIPMLFFYSNVIFINIIFISSVFL